MVGVVVVGGSGWGFRVSGRKGITSTHAMLLSVGHRAGGSLSNRRIRMRKPPFIPSVYKPRVVTLASPLSDSAPCNPPDHRLPVFIGVTRRRTALPLIQPV